MRVCEVLRSWCTLVGGSCIEGNTAQTFTPGSGATTTATATIRVSVVLFLPDPPNRSPPRHGAHPDPPPRTAATPHRHRHDASDTTPYCRSSTRSAVVLVALVFCVALVSFETTRVRIYYCIRYSPTRHDFYRRRTSGKLDGIRGNDKSSSWQFFYCLSISPRLFSLNRM